jgi:hypothetical protein
VEDDEYKGVAITAQTGWNEAFIIGTEQELLDFAKSIIDAVKRAKPDEFFGEHVTASNSLCGNTASHSEVQFDWLVVTKDSKQTLKICHKVQGL